MIGSRPLIDNILVRRMSFDIGGIAPCADLARRRIAGGQCNNRAGASIMDFEAVMAWVLVGTIAGYVAGLVLEGRGHGMAAAIGLGNAGAVVAGAVLPRLGIFGGLDLFSNVMSATAGALALLIAAAMIRRP